MKKKLIYLTVIMAALLTSGCSKNDNQENQQPTVPNPTQNSQVTEQSGTGTTGDTGKNDGADANGGNGTDNTGGANTGTEAAMLTEEEAKAIALQHAGLTADEVTFIKSGIDRDNGRKTYDVEFYTNDQKEYDYEIDPYTGEILDYDYDAEYYHQSSDIATGDEISASKAKEIALAEVPGATEQDIFEFESDYDNGKLRYEGKIFYEQKEYEFEIDAQSGTILEWNVEAIHNNTP